jgi:hypothetical protein
MAFEFMREELAEARYMRRPGDATGKSAYDIGESFFEHMMLLQQMRHTNPAWARKYAKDTLRYQSFSQVRTGATDMHNLAAILANPSKYSDKVGDLGSVNFDELQLKRWLRDIAAGKQRTSMDRTFFLKQQKNLGIRNSFLRQVRRVMGDYGTSNSAERSIVTSRMLNTFRQDGQFRSDMFKPYVQSAKGQIDPKDITPAKGPIPDWAKLGLGVAAAGYVGYKIGYKYF